MILKPELLIWGSFGYDIPMGFLEGLPKENFPVERHFRCLYENDVKHLSPGQAFKMNIHTGKNRVGAPYIPPWIDTTKSKTQGSC